MTEKEKEAVESLRIKAEYIGDNYSFGVQGIINLRNELSVVLNLIEKKDKMIDLMAQELIDIAIEAFLGRGSFKYRNKEDTIEHFRKKVENDN